MRVMPPTGVGGGGVRDIRVYGAIQGGIWEISIFTDTMGSMAVWLALRVDGATIDGSRWLNDKRIRQATPLGLGFFFGFLSRLCFSLFDCCTGNSFLLHKHSFQTAWVGFLEEL